MYEALVLICPTNAYDSVTNIKIINDDDGCLSILSACLPAFSHFKKRGIPFQAGRKYICINI
jgi:hypothetical protein